MPLKDRRVALVLGAGGPVGHAFHSGALAALETRFDWDSRSAELVVGTSAGAQVGALLRAGLRGTDLLARVMDQPMSDEAAAIARHYTRPPRTPSPAYPRRVAPASPGYLWQCLRRPWQTRPGRLIASVLPHGRACLRQQADGFAQMFESPWPERPLWITAVRISDGSAVTFGTPEAPGTDVGTAVTCSGAVPGVCAPVEVEGAHFIDGGIACATHLHLMADVDVDVVVAISPLSRYPLMRWLFWRQVRRLEALGIQVITVEPDVAVRRAMGLNPMKLERSAPVAEAAYAQLVGATRV